jgi:aspartate aminotransferase/aminotransferase
MVKNKITPNTKALLINNPNNPSGAVYSENELKKIAEIADNHNIIIISDEIYEHFTYAENHFSIGSIYPNTITMNGFSKAYAMTGWRLGYMTGPEKIIETINNLIQYIVFSSNSISQVAALKALELDPSEMIKKYAEKRRYIIDELSDHYEINGAQGAYYFFLKVPPKYKDAYEFCQEASKNKLMILPGSAFSQNNSYFRISYGAPMKDVKRGVEILKKLA